ncbi:hypothetical protein, partial [Stenoxybacter acetivorans]|uniref:hypothetical protein n=1 Tax=Stenoxybacter acetivorans TaxID=422441 RepID=UPI0012EC2B2F
MNLKLLLFVLLSLLSNYFTYAAIGCLKNLPNFSGSLTNAHIHFLQAETHGSHVSAEAGDIGIQAKQIDISAAENSYRSEYRQESEQKGINVSVSAPVVSVVEDTVKGAVNAVQSTQKIGASNNGRVNAMVAANSGYGLYQAGKNLNNIGENLKNAAGADQAKVKVVVT